MCKGTHKDSPGNRHCFRPFVLLLVLLSEPMSIIYPVSLYTVLLVVSFSGLSVEHAKELMHIVYTSVLSLEFGNVSSAPI